MKTNLDPELVATDKLLDAWARDGRRGTGGGGMHPLERLRLLHDGVVLGPPDMSNDEVMIIVDRAVLDSPERTRLLLATWYKSNSPSQVKARRLGISRSALYTHWRAALWYIRGLLRGRGISV
jgi:hypothetical protein